MVLVRLDKELKTWTQIDKKDKESDDLYLDGRLKDKLDHAKKKIKKNFDVGGIIVGDEGSGKSTLASNMMIYMTDGEFDPRRDIIKSHEDAILKLEKVPDGSGVMFDEGYLLFYSADALTKAQKNITKIFSIIRQKNLFFLIVAPSFFRLATYFALDRTKFILRVYDKGGERGYFQYWGHKRKERLYRFGKPKHHYGVVSPTSSGRFTKCSMLDAEYDQIKRETLKQAFAEAKVSQKVVPTARSVGKDFRRDFVDKNTTLNNKELAEVLQCSERQIYLLKNEIALIKEQNKRHILAVS